MKYFRTWRAIQDRKSQPLTSTTMLTDNQRFRLNQIWRTFTEFPEFARYKDAMDKEMKRIFEEQDQAAAHDLIGFYFASAEKGVITYLEEKQLIKKT